MNHRDIAVLMEGIAPVLRGYVERAFEPIGVRLAAVENRLNDLPQQMALPEVDPLMILRLVQEEVAKIPPAPAGRDVDPKTVASLVAAEVAKLPPAEPGKDADPDVLKQMIDEAVAALPAPVPGKDADPALIAELVERAVAALPPAKDGEPGPAGDSVTVDQLAPLVAEEVAKAVAGLPVPPAGKDADPELVARMVAAAVTEAVAALPAPRDGKDGRDGVGVAGAFIDRSGELTVTLSDGAMKSLGLIVGKDGQPGEAGKDGEPGRDGADGLGFEDMSIEHDGERGFVLRFERGQIKKEFPFTIPSVIDRGVWREGQYQKGDGATWAGSFFIAQRDTTDKPETSDAWRLSVKRGRDGKDGKPGERGPDGLPGKAGRDLTQVGADGAKW
jgi:hypothetical protein